MSTYVRSSIYFSGNAIARRHGALNIGGNLCQIGTEAFEGFIGVIDEVMDSNALYHNGFSHTYILMKSEWNCPFCILRVHR